MNDNSEGIQPPAELPPVSEPPPVPAPTPVSQRSRRSWALYAASLIGTLVVGVLGLLLVLANQDRSDLDATISAKDDEIDRLTGELTAVSGREDVLLAQNGDLEAQLATALEDVADADVRLEEAQQVRDSVVDFFAASMLLGGVMEETEAQCVADALVADLGVSELLTGALDAAGLGLGTPSGSETLAFGLAVFSAAEDCGVDLNEVGPTGLQPGFGYGDNPILDSYYDDCAAGSLSACDDLYQQSAVGSDYETFGRTCGDRYSLADAPFACATSGAFGLPDVSGVALPVFQSAQEDSAVGLAAPTVTGQDFDGRSVTVGGSGNPTAIVFLAHWCSHCEAEVPRVQAWLDGGGGVSGVDIVSVVTSTDPARFNFPPSDWLEREGWTTPVIVDDQIGSVHMAFGRGGFPYWVFLEGDGRVAARSAGELDISALEDFLQLIAD